MAAKVLRFNDIHARFQIGAMNCADNGGLRQRKDVAVVLEINRPVGKAFAPIVSLGTLVLLDHRSHCAVEHENPVLELFQRLGRTGICIL